MALASSTDRGPDIHVGKSASKSLRNHAAVLVADGAFGVNCCGPRLSAFRSATQSPFAPTPGTLQVRCCQLVHIWLRPRMQVSVANTDGLPGGRHYNTYRAERSASEPDMVQDVESNADSDVFREVCVQATTPCPLSPSIYTTH